MTWVSLVSHLVPIIVATCFILFALTGSLRRQSNRRVTRLHEQLAEIEREVHAQATVRPRPPATPRPPAPPAPPKKPGKPRYIVLAAPLEGEEPTAPDGEFTNKRDAEAFARRLSKAQPTSEIVMVRIKDQEYLLVLPPRDVPHLTAEGEQVRDEEEI